MYRCSSCGRLIEEDELVLIEDDPSPSGIALPSGSYTYAFCPHCGEGITDSDEFSLAEALDIEEKTETEAIISLFGQSILFALTADGKLDASRI